MALNHLRDKAMFTRHIQNKKGAALVEFAIVAMLLFLLTFGIIEFSLMMKDYLSLNQAAREGARVAALHADRATVIQVVRTSAVGISVVQPSDIGVVPSYRVNSGTGWGDWIIDKVPPANAGGEIQIRVKATYKHPLILGPLFGLGDTKTLTGDMVWHRE